MSMYNLLHGNNPLAGVLLWILGTTSDRVPRIRDVYPENGNIIIYTRTGGGNRPYYDSLETAIENDHVDPKDKDISQRAWNSDLRALPGFIRDYDDDFDSTYAYFEFTPPEDWKQIIQDLSDTIGAQSNPTEKFQRTLAAIGAPDANPKELPEINEQKLKDALQALSDKLTEKGYFDHEQDMRERVGTEAG